MAIINDKETLARQESSGTAPRRSQDILGSLTTDGPIIPNLEPPVDAPPAYGENHDHLQFSRQGIEAGAVVTDDGRVNININTKGRRLADLLAPTLASQLAQETSLPPAYIPPSLEDQPGKEPPPRLNVVIQIVGSRGDVQPFVALGKILKETYGHRVRVATHPSFQSFVEDNGLEFFSIGGDPAELMAFMVKHPGLMPGLDALKSGEISRRRKGVQEMLIGCWRSCIEAGNGLGPPPKAHSANQPWDPSSGVPGDPNQEPFVADAIIANPPSFAHIHVAEKMGIPLHIMFTMPWSPTRAFPHPLANIQSSNAGDVMTNYLSYTLVEMMTWQGLGDVINRFREKALDLAPLSLIWAPGLLSRLRVPYTYCWSPALIPKPNDWGSHVDISGFFFLNLASSYTPDPELAAFLEEGPPPVYIGFGSIVVDDPTALTRMIFDAVHIAGVRALVSKGWGGLGADAVGQPDGVFMLGNVPHDWLFDKVSCVVHHGGAGTTAAGIKAGKPTLVVPFFGDQPFWGAMIARANAGPDPIPHKQMTAEKLAEAIKYCLQPDTQQQAKVLGQKIREEKGTDVGGRSFHNHLNVDVLRCSLAPSRVAVWRVRRTKVRLSSLAATVLVNHGVLKYSDLKLYRPIEFNTDDQPPDPITAGAVSLVTDMSTIGMAIADMPRDLFKSTKKMRASQVSLADTASQGTEGASISGSRGGSTADVAATMPPVTTQSSTGANEHAPASNNVQCDLQQSISGSSLTLPPSTEGERPHTPDLGGSRTASKQLEGPLSPAKETPTSQSEVNLEAAIDAGRGVSRVVTTSVKSPMNFCLGLARGFRNIPKLYNDDTIRPVDKVTDISSGFKVAGKEFGFGLYDGISGLVTQPIKGAQKDGTAGFIKGFGKGIGGLMAKPAAGFWGLPAYVMQGAYAEVNKLMSKSVQNYIITSRVVQGEMDVTKATEGEKTDILNRWNTDVRHDIKNFESMKRRERAAEKAPAGQTPASPGGRSTSRLVKRLTGGSQNLGISSERGATASDSQSSLSQNRIDADSEFENAIQVSVRETSRGNAEEDAMIEEAIRGSVNAIRQNGDLPNPVPIHSDVKDPTIFEDEEYRITDEEYQALIEQAIQDSLANHGSLLPLPQQSDAEPLVPGSPHPANSSEDVELKRAIQESQNPPSLPPRYATSDNDDEQLRQALEASKNEMDQEKSQRTEEDIVMEYVKKQSLAEEQFRQQRLVKEKSNMAEHEHQQPTEDDEELRKAIEESLKLSRGDSSGPSGSAAQ